MNVRSTAAILVATCFAALDPVANSMESAASWNVSSSTVGNEDVRAIAQALLDMPGFDDIFHSELTPDRLPFAVVGLPSAVKLVKCRRSVVVLSATDAAKLEHKNYLMFHELTADARAGHVVAEYPSKDLTLRVELSRRGGRWVVTQSRLEQR